MGSLEAKNIFCIASKEDEDEQIYFLYAQEKISKSLFLFEIKMQNQVI